MTDYEIELKDLLKNVSESINSYCNILYEENTKKIFYKGYMNDILDEIIYYFKIINRIFDISIPLKSVENISNIIRKIILNLKASQFAYENFTETQHIFDYQIDISHAIFKKEVLKFAESIIKYNSNMCMNLQLFNDYPEFLSDLLYSF